MFLLLCLKVTTFFAIHIIVALLFLYYVISILYAPRTIVTCFRKSASELLRRERQCGQRIAHSVSMCICSLRLRSSLMRRVV